MAKPGTATSPGADVRTGPLQTGDPLQFDLGVSAALLAASACAAWTWRRTRVVPGDTTGKVRRVVLARRALVCVIAAVVVAPFAPWLSA